MRSVRKIVWFGVFVCLVSLRASLGDSPRPPTECEVFSENERIVGHITPASSRLVRRGLGVFEPPGFSREMVKPAKLRVYSVETGNRTLLWEADLDNEVSPGEVYVSDDGEYAVTLDNWGNAGYGNNVLALYGRDGLIRKYSLEEIFGQRWKSGAEYFRKKFRHTASSRWWRYNSIEFFDRSDGLFCIWIDWEERWLAWELESGEGVEGSKEQVLRWSKRAREQMLSLIEEGEGHLKPYEFLGKMKMPEDKPLMEGLLKDSKFCTATDTGRVGGGGVGFRYCSWSDWRVAGDRILSNWENSRGPGDYVEKEGICVDEKYTFLGSLNLTVSYAEAPREGEGYLRMHVIPSDSKPSERGGSKADAYLIADLDFGHAYDKDGSRYSRLGKSVNFSIRGVRPGRHEVVAVWDRMAPFCHEDSIACVGQSGDFVSLKSTEVDVKAGEAVENVSISCMKLVE
jgi:hypothetical protein